MGQGAAVFAKLSSTQGGDIFDASHLCAPHIGAELLVAKHSQPLFETQLEPVAAGDTVAGPIVEIFMGDDGFDPFEIAVHCGFRTGQNGGGIKYIQTFVFHRAHVEIIYGDDIEDRKVIFAAINTFVPGHTGLERLEGEGAFVLIAIAHIDIQIYRLA